MFIPKTAPAVKVSGVPVHKSVEEGVILATVGVALTVIDDVVT